MDDCCEGKTSELQLLRTRQGRVLKWVLFINAVMFLVEGLAGLLADSSALLADSLDMFGDAAVYALTLYVIDRGARWRARAALVKGGLMALFGAGVLVKAGFNLLTEAEPQAPTMGGIGLLALVANVTCLALLYRHRSDDLNMRSTWLCSRNDIIANGFVILAAVLVSLTGRGVPDVVVGVLIAALFLKSAFGVLRASVAELKQLSLVK